MTINSAESQLSSFQLGMYRQVVADHAVATEHTAYCCGIAASYEVMLSGQPAATPTPVSQKYTVKAAYGDRAATEPQVRYVRGLMANYQISSTEMATWGAMLMNGLTFGQADTIIKAMKDRPLADKNRERMATPAQIGYAQKLLDVKQWGEPVDLDTITFTAMGDLLTALKAAPYKPRGAAKPSGTVEGIYFFDGLYVKVQLAVHGSGRPYTKVFDPQTESWERKGGYLRKLKPEHKLTAELAANFGHLYGCCVRCMATLTDEESIERGYGPICAEKMGF